MANSIATPNGALIARRALETLLEEFPFLRLITADFSPEVALFNQTLNVKLPTALTAGDYSTSNGYVTQDVSQVDVPLVINKHKHVTYAFDDQERSSTDMNLIERFARNAAHAIGLVMMNDLLALVVAANFSNSTTVTVANMDRSKIVALSKTLNGRKIPSMGRFALVNSDYFEKLANDTSLIANAGSPNNTVRSGQLGDVHGFRVVEYAQLPNNSESLNGFGGVPEGLVIATRLPQIPDQSEIPGRVEIVTEPNTGLSLQVRSWYDMQKGKEFRTYTLMYGVAKGNTACIERLKIA